MESGLYHRDICWYAEFDNFFSNHDITKIEFSKHTKENQCKETKRIYDIEDITLDFVKGGVIFEVEVENDKIKKIVVRRRYKEKKDICMVFLLKGQQLFCKTCWLNSQDDVHDTLDASQYVGGREKSENMEKMKISILDLIKNKESKK